MAAKKRAAPPPAQFFESVVPRVLSIMKKSCTELGGRYVITVSDVGSWTLDFPTQKVTAGAAAAAADVGITLSAAQFQKLSSGKVELLKWAKGGEAPFTGDVNKLENISLVLAFLE